MVIIIMLVFGTRQSTEQDDIKELKRQLKLQAHQVDQLKEEASFQEAIVTKVNLARVNAEKDAANLQVSLRQLLISD